MAEITTYEPLLTDEKISLKIKTEEKPQKKEIDKPYYPSNFISNLFFYWAFPALKSANHSSLKIPQLGLLNENHSSKYFVEDFKTIWYGKKLPEANKRERIHRTRRRCPLFRAILWANCSGIILMLVISIITLIFELLGIFFFRQIVLTFQEKITEKPYFPLPYTVAALLGIKFLNIFFSRKNNFIIYMVGSKTTVQLNGLIYDKLMKVATFSKGVFSEGELVNFIQIDSEKFSEFLSNGPRTFILPFQFGFYIYLLFQYFGLTFLSGLTVLLILMLIISKLQQKRLGYVKEYMAHKDERMRISSQTLNMITLIKLYAWEDEFMKKIEAKRNEEVICLRKIQNNSLFGNTLYWSSSTLVCVTAIIFYNLFNPQMEISNILTSIYIFNTISEPIFIIPAFISGLLESFISLRRIEKFLHVADIDTSLLIKSHKKIENSVVIRITNCDFSFDESNSENTHHDKGNKDHEMLDFEPHSKFLLNKINIEVYDKELIGVVGEVGSGKTCLVNAILNNLEIINRDKNPNSLIEINGNISYVSQNSWILNDTLRNNILFFKEMDERKYATILDICELIPDIKQIPGGDLAEIGERGINLSGGQKARVALARSLYSEADIFLFDDPLSALDAHVGMRIFNRVMKDYLKNKTRFIVTHALQYISHTDRVIYMKRGTIEWFGKSSDLNQQEFYLEFLDKAKIMRDQELKNSKNALHIDEDIPKGKEDEELELTRSSSSKTKEIIRITKDEDQKEGSVKCRVWCIFFWYLGGASIITITIILNVLWTSCEVGSNYWLTFWTVQEHLSNATNISYLLIYSALCFSVTILIFFRAVTTVTGLIRLNVKIHDCVLSKLIRAPKSFHDSTPKGQILNRLSKDLENSTWLCWILNGTLRIVFQLIGCITICSLFNIYSLICLPILLVFELLILRFYVSGGRDLNRLEGISRSPIIGVFSETIPGVATIRACNYEDNFRNKFFSKLDDFYKVRLFQNGATGWFGTHLDLISFLMLVFLLCFAIIFKNSFSSQAIGLLLSYSMRLIENLYYFLERSTIFERLLTSIERCDSYTNIAQEKSYTTDKDKELEGWPMLGGIKFVNYSVKYSNEPEAKVILHNLNFEILPGQKIGIVGRTGSGKSTFCLGLFRILEPFEGSIFIDNVDITEIGLKKLRESMTIIPQDPTFIEGTLRENIDPLSIHQDDEIIQVLKEIGLGYLIENEDTEIINRTSLTDNSQMTDEKNSEHSGLARMIQENGGNLSVGERQLICIGRAILRKTKIVIMDEATSSIDYNTETLIQQSISNSLRNSTVITIAHRIKTIIHYDKIMVLSEGQIIEFDSPSTLIENSESVFYELYKQSAL